MFAFKHVIGPGRSNEQCAKNFKAEHCREYSTISSTDGIRNFFLIAVISAYPYFGMPTIARIPALHAVCKSESSELEIVASTTGLLLNIRPWIHPIYNMRLSPVVKLRPSTLILPAAERILLHKREIWPF